MDEFDRSVEIFEPGDYKPYADASGDEVRYNCPVCIDIRGKEDDDGKMYWNTAKRKGYCFKCNTVFYPNTDDLDDGGDAEYHQVMSGFLDKIVGYDQLEYEEPDEIAFDFPPLKDDLLFYLKDRNPFLLHLAPTLGLHGWYGRDKGVVTPFFYKEKIIKFQTRFISRQDPKAAKYYTSEGTKVLYSPRHIFGTRHSFELLGEQTVTLVEGTYDAIACAIMGFPNPLAVLGSSLTKYQCLLLKKLSPFKAFCFLDDWKLNKALERQVKREVDTIDEVEIPRLGKGDPEEILKILIKDSTMKRECAERVAQWIKE